MDGRTDTVLVALGLRENGSAPGQKKLSNIRYYCLIIKLTSNDLDSIGFLFRLPFLLSNMTLRYIYVRASYKTLLLLLYFILLLGETRSRFALLE